MTQKDQCRHIRPANFFGEVIIIKRLDGLRIIVRTATSYTILDIQLIAMTIIISR